MAIYANENGSLKTLALNAEDTDFLTIDPSIYKSQLYTICANTHIDGYTSLVVSRLTKLDEFKIPKSKYFIYFYHTNSFNDEDTTENLCLEEGTTTQPFTFCGKTNQFIIYGSSSPKPYFYFARTSDFIGKYLNFASSYTSTARQIRNFAVKFDDYEHMSFYAALADKSSNKFTATSYMDIWLKTFKFFG